MGKGVLPDSVPYVFGGPPARRLSTLATKRIIEAYRQRFQYDASPCFEGIDDIGLYECPESGVRFYYPFEVAGPESLYRRLQEFEWNYKEGKWEHSYALTYASAGLRVLDVGCGEGGFLALAAARGAIVAGLEFNERAGERARARGLEIGAEDLSRHARERPGHYDVVTSFQVLEHVVNPCEFLQDCLALLKPGGVLILGVPNDDGFVGMDHDAVLNMPPHHMSRWSRRSLEAVASHFGLIIQAIECEPLQEIHWYKAVMEKAYLTGWLRRKLYYWLGFSELFERYLADRASTIDGHTIVGVFRKPA